MSVLPEITSIFDEYNNDFGKTSLQSKLGCRYMVWVARSGERRNGDGKEGVRL